MVKTQSAYKTESLIVMKVVFRTDSSLLIGTGHLMRCLALAGELSTRGAQVVFICRNLPGNMNTQVLRNGHKLHELPLDDNTLMNNPGVSEYERWLAVEKETDAFQTGRVLAEKENGADVLVVDHYALDSVWEREVLPYIKRLMVIDDLANRRHDCHILLDQNLYENMDKRYEHLVGADTQLLLGPTFALLRKEFNSQRKVMAKRDGRVRKVMVSFGGADRTNETLKFLDSLAEAKAVALNFEVIVGKTNPNNDIIKEKCDGMANVAYYRAVNDIARLMVEVDLAVGAGGTSTWERCCLGLPAVTVAVAENQVEVARLSERMGFAVYLGISEQVSADRMIKYVTELAEDRPKMVAMSSAGMKLVDGLGVNRVCDILYADRGVNKYS